MHIKTDEGGVFDEMENCHLTRDKLIQNLRDARCDEKTIEKYFVAIDSGDKKLVMSYIDCLDYFVMQSEKMRK